MKENIVYKINHKITTDAYIDVLNRSGLGERRPVNEPDRIKTMLENSNLTITAWLENNLIGVSRSVTDFAFCCYLSDLAVDKEFQNFGIGKKLVQLTKEEIGDKVMLLLLSAPAAMDYYPKIGFEKSDNAFIINRKK